MDTSEQQLIKLWMTGTTCRSIGLRLGMSASRVCVQAQRLGLPRRVRPLTEADRARFVELYTGGFTIADVARRTGFHRDTVRNALLKMGVPLRGAWRKWPIRHDAFSAPMSPEAWYWVGLLAADGYVRGASITLNLKNSSEPVLRRFLAFAGSPNRPLRRMNKGRAKGACISSPMLVADLARHGVVRRKSLTLRTSPEAAAEPGFWLGAFDGDGCITISDKGVPLIGLVGTRAFMSQFAGFLETRVGGSQPAIVRCRSDSDRLWQVRVGGDRARQLAELWLACLPTSLEAKRARLELAAEYESRVTRARIAVRWRRCDFCGRWVERMPSQLHRHVFCSRGHYWAWRALRDQGRRESNPQKVGGTQLQLAPSGL